MAGPLDGVRIIDLTAMISGPLATMTLADQGADVIKVETPTGDFSRHVATRRGGYAASFLNNNRNKRSVVIDLKKPGGREALLRLVAGADVFVQNFRPGVIDRMGLGEEAVRAVNPSIVYVSICGFGFEGPYADKPVFDPLIQALSGLTTVQAGSDEARPRLVRTILPDKLTAIQASQAITAALFARARTGQGQHVRLSMLDTIVAFLWSSDMGGHTFVGDECESETAQSFIDLIYQCADGYLTIAVMQDKHWRGMSGRSRAAAMRDVNKDARTRLTQEAVAGFALDDLIARLEAHDVPCAPVLTRRDMRDHPQVAANGIVVESDHPAAGRLRQTRQPARFSAVPDQPMRGAPALGEHSRQVLAEAGLSAAEIDALVAAGTVQEPEPETEMQGADA